MRYIQGDITTTDLPIAHGVNCQNKMGSGVAKALYTKWPEVKAEYHTLCEVMAFPEGMLGWAIEVQPKGRENSIFNLYTQLNYGYDGSKYVNYGAIATSFEELINLGVTEVAIPKIGCGLAGGDWNVVEPLIEDIALGRMSITVYYL